MRFKDLKIGTRIWLITAIGISALVIMAFIGYPRLIHLQETFQELKEESNEMHIVMDLSLALSRVVMPANDYLILGGDPNEKANFEKIAKEVKEQFKKLEPHALNHSDEKEIFLTAKKNYLDLKQKALQIFAIPQEQAYASKKAGRLTEELDSLADEAILTLKKLHEIADKKIAEAEEEFVRAQREVILFGSFLILFLIFFALVVGVVLTRSIVKPLRKLSAVTEIIGKGDLSQKAEVKTRDEIGQLSTSFNKMTEDLQKSMDELVSAKDYADNIIANMIDTLIVVNPEGMIKTVNKATLDLLGYKEEELLGQSVGKIFAEEEEEELLFKGRRLRKLIEEGSVRDFDMTYVTKSGEKIPVSFSGGVMHEGRETRDDGRVVQASKASDRPSSIVNRKIIGIVGVARDMREIKGLIANLQDANMELEEWSKTLEKRVKERTKELEQAHEATINIKEELAKSNVELKKTEVQIKASLREKEVLLREIHHRVKNNMQVISSLLSLQSRTIKDKEALDVFKESQNRVRSMALIHEKFYQSKYLMDIDFKEYIKELANGLLRSYGIDASKITLKIEVEDISFEINSAISCGLLLNEMISNSLKHAFPATADRPESSSGEIKISLKTTEKGEIELKVCDNGVGIPKDLDFRKTESLGLQLVVTLAEEQLGGKIELNKGAGTEFKITFRTHPTMDSQG